MEIKRSTLFWVAAAAGIGGVLWWMSRQSKKNVGYQPQPFRPRTQDISPPGPAAPGMKWSYMGPLDSTNHPDMWFQVPIDASAQPSGNPTLDAINKAAQQVTR